MSTPPRRKLPEVEEVRDYLKSFDFFERHVGNRWEGDFYADVHARRFVETMKFLPALPERARVLELGAVPYYMTCLLKRHFGLGVEPLSFYEVEAGARARHTVESARYGERYEFEYAAINVERDLFPFADETFDLVLCCEILEHLLINPSHMLYESHRVLRPGGRLLVTTPNVLQWRNVFALLRGRNIYDLYRGNGVYGRHNREYAPAEVAELLEANGFEVERLETVHVYGAEFFNSVPFIFDRRRDNIFALARRGGEHARMSFPASLYVLMDEYRNAARSSVKMGVNETGQIGRGWHEFERGGPGFRWSMREAELFLKNDGAQRLVLELCCHHPEVERGGVRLRVRVNGIDAGEATLAQRDWQELSFALPPGVRPDTVLRCELSVSETWVPKASGVSEDVRELGVGLSRARAE